MSDCNYGPLPWPYPNCWSKWLEWFDAWPCPPPSEPAKIKDSQPEEPSDAD